MLVEKDKIEKAKAIISEETPDLIAEMLNIEKWDSKNRKGCCVVHNEDTPSMIWDKKRNSFHCFAKNTMVITKNGTKAIQDLVGTKTEIINGNGDWEEVIFVQCGEQPTMNVELQKGTFHKTIVATPEHEWIVRKGEKEIKVETQYLKNGMRLAKRWKTADKDIVPDVQGLRHGFIFGDGTYSHKSSNGDLNYHARICTEQKKKFCDLVFEPEHKRDNCKSEYESIPQCCFGRITYHSQDGIDLKAVPDPEKFSLEYIYGFIIGLFYADGNCTDETLIINSANKETLIAIKHLCTLVGIPTYPIGQTCRKAGKKLGVVTLHKDSIMYTLRLAKACIKESFFITGNKFKTKNIYNTYLGFKVVNVTNNSNVEPVYCCETSTHSFVLEDFILVGNCFGCNRNIDILDAYMMTGDTYIQAVQKLFEKANIKYAFGEVGVKKDRDYRYPHLEDCGSKDKIYKYLGMRCISPETIDATGITQDEEGNICFNYVDTSDVLTMVKKRPSRKVKHGENKNWCQPGSDTAPLLFNMNRINVSAPLVITEGEIDALALIECGITNTVSIPLGAGNTHWIEHNWDWLEQFDSIIVCFDNDEAGVKARKEVVPRLGSWRTKYVEIPPVFVKEDGTEIALKDANEVLYYAGREAVIDLITNAEDPGVPSVINVSDVQDIDLDEMDGVETGVKELDAEIMKLFYGTLTVVSGKPGCVDKDTEYFNGQEWKKISEFQNGERVLQYNKDGTAELVTPSQYIKLPCDKFYHLKTRHGIDQMLSEEHNVVYISSKGNLCTKQMEDVYQMHNNTIDGFQGKFIPSFRFCGNGVDITDDEIRLMCAVICDGHFSDNVSSEAKTYGRCRINLKKERKKRRLEELLKACGINYSVHQYNPRDLGFNTYLFFPPIKTKEFPTEWYHFSGHQREIFVDEVLRWDGHIDSRGRMSFSSSNKHNIDFVQFMFSASGHKTTIYIDDRVGQPQGEKYIRKNISYELTITHKVDTYTSIHHSKKKIDISIVSPEDRFKYCFTVPSHMLVLRRNGNIFVTGNCGKSSFLSQLMCQSLEQDKPVWMFSREMPCWMERNWLNYIMAGAHHIKEYEDVNGAKYYKIEPDAKNAIGQFYDKKWFLYRDDWSNKLDDIMISMEDSVRKYGAKLLIVDNLMTIDLDQNENSELLKQTECIDRLIKFAMKYSVAVVLVAHPRKTPAGEDVGLYDVAGSSNIVNLAHRTIGLRRIDQEKEHSNYDVCLTVIKDRMRGKAGKKINLYYDVPTRRFYTNEKEYSYQYGWDAGDYPDLPYPHENESEVFGEV